MKRYKKYKPTKYLCETEEGYWYARDLLLGYVTDPYDSESALVSALEKGNVVWSNPTIKVN